MESENERIKIKDKEKRIEEMAIRFYDVANNKDLMLTPNPYSLVGWSKIAKELLKHYQVVDKDSVVLSREEYEKLHSFDLAFKILAEPNPVLISAEEYEKLKQSHKEMVEKIIDWIDTYYPCYSRADLIKELAKQLGVEINNGNSFNTDEFNKGYAQGIKDLKNSKRC